MNNFSNDLSEFSASYYQNADVYKLFSDAEDREGLIWQHLKERFTNKKILDLGCGNGRYLELIHSVTPNCVGVDQSLSQVQQGKKNLPFIVSDGCTLPFVDDFFDYTISCWVWGTILDDSKREKIFLEAKRVTKPGGSIILIENDTPSEFEYYRGRHLNTKTQDYNDWILKHNFKILKRLETFITFDSIELTQFVFNSIWNGRLFEVPKKSKIQNNVIIFDFKID